MTNGHPPGTSAPDLGRRTLTAVATRFLIIGGGPAGNTAATYAARLGAQVTMVERDIVGGAAHLLDCIPSKTMIATGGAMSFLRRSTGMGLEQASAQVDTEALTNRIEGIKTHLQTGTTQLLQSQNVRLVTGSARFVSPTSAEVETVAGTEVVEFDVALVATGSRPRIPEWCSPDGDRILTTRDCYPPKEFPTSVTIVGSGVTGVEFVHMFASFGAQVTLVVSRQQVLPGKDPEVAAVLEAGLPRPRRAAAQGCPGDVDRARPREGRGRRAAATTVGSCARRTPCWRSARCRTPTASGSTRPGSRSTAAGTSRSTTTASRTCRTSTPPAT